MAEKAAQTQTAQRTFRKASREQVSMKKDMKGVIEGTFRGFVTKEIKDKTNRGEIKEIPSYNFDLPDGRLTTVLGDAGLKGEITNADLHDGDYVRITHKGEKDLGNGKRVNQYIVEIAD